MSYEHIPKLFPQSSFFITNPKIQQKFQDSGMNDLAKLMNVIATTLTYTDGRDKSMKVIQYTLSVLMITVLKKRQLLVKYHKNIEGIMKMFGDARKIVRLLNSASFLAKLIHLIQGRGLNPHSQLGLVEKNHYGLLLLKTISEFCNCITDDIFCLSRFNILNRPFGDKAKTWSIKLWWTSLSIDIYFHIIKIWHTKRKIADLKEHSSKPADIEKEKEKEVEVIETQDQIKRLETEVGNLQLNTVKILADMVFCGYDLFHIKSHIEFMHFAGIVSGYIGYSRLFKKTYNTVKA